MSPRLAPLKAIREARTADPAPQTAAASDAMHPGSKGPLSKPTTATEFWPQERVFLPLFQPSGIVVRRRDAVLPVTPDGFAGRDFVGVIVPVHLG
jgi:hypothetical protein